ATLLHSFPTRRSSDLGGADAEPVADADDCLALLFLSCHPPLSPPSPIALTLPAVGGLTTGQIAAAFLVPEATMAGPGEVERQGRSEEHTSELQSRSDL